MGCQLFWVNLFCVYRRAHTHTHMHGTWKISLYFKGVFPQAWFMGRHFTQRHLYMVRERSTHTRARRQRHTDRQTKTQKQTQTSRQRHRQADRQTQVRRQTDIDTHTHTGRHKTHIHRQTHTGRETHMHTEINTHTEFASEAGLGGMVHSLPFCLGSVSMHDRGVTLILWLKKRWWNSYNRLCNNDKLPMWHKHFCFSSC